MQASFANETPGKLFDHAAAPLCAVDQGPLAGLRHRTAIDSRTGSRALALWQEEHRSGFEVPEHRHDCEEIIAVIEGSIRATIAGETFEVQSGQSILIPEGSGHGFQVTSAEPVKLLALFASNNPLIFRLDGTPSLPPWEGGAADHLAKAGIQLSSES